MLDDLLRLCRQRCSLAAVSETLTLATLATVAFNVHLSPFTVEAVRVPILLFELPLAGLFVLTIPRLTRARRWPRGLTSWLATALALMLIISAAVHPSWFTFIRLYRFAAAAVFCYSIFVLALGIDRKRLFLVAAGVAVFQAYVATGQHLLNKGMGYSFLGETDHLLVGERSSTYVQGTFPLHHILAAFCMVALALLVLAPAWQSKRAPLSWLLAVAAAAVPIGFAYSRTGAIAWFATVAVLGLAGVRRQGTSLAFAGAVLIGGLAAGVVGLDGWIARTTETVRGSGPGGSNEDDAGLDVGGRLELAAQGLRVIERQPIFGTGIGRYVSVARDQQGEHVQQYVHNVPLLIAAESGLLAGTITMSILTIVAIAAIRTGALPLAAFVSYLPFVLFDHFPYEDTQGIGLTGIWMAAVAIGIHWGRERPTSKDQ